MQAFIQELDSLMGQARWDEAEALLLLYKNRAEARGDRQTELSLCNELVGFYRQRQKEAGFMPNWQRCQELLEELNVRGVSRGTILINGATALVSFGRAEEALPYYQEAFGCYIRGLSPADERFAALFNNMASAFQAVGAYERAEEHMKMAMDVLEKKPHHVDIATTWVNLAQLYARWGRPAAMTEALERAMERFDDPEVLWNDYYAHTCRKCAGAFGALGRPDWERELQERADMVYEGT